MMKNAKRAQDKFLQEIYYTGESLADPLILSKYTWFNELVANKYLIVLEKFCRIHPTESCLDYIENLLGIDPTCIEC